jgi:hypothetical protein
MFTVKQAVEILNKEFQSFNLEFSTNENLPCSVFENQIKTFAKLTKQIFENPSKNKIILGMLQSGKTGTTMLVHLFPVIAKLINDDNYIVIDLLTNRLGHKKQTEQEMDNFYNCFENVKITSNNKSLSLKDYTDEINNRFNFPTTVYARTNNKTNINKLNDFVKSAKEQNFNVIYAIDEIHWGQEANSVFEKYLKNNLDNIKSNRSKDIFIGASATPFQYSNLTEVETIHQFLGDNYHGPNFYEGEIHDYSAKTTNQTIIGFNELALPLNEVIPNAFHFINQFNDFRNYGLFDAENIQEYRKTCSNIFEQFIKEVFENKTKTGMVVRWTNDNQSTNDFIKTLNLENITVINYYGKNANLDIKQTIIEETLGSNENFIIFVTGAARMADAFPINVKYFVDFTFESATLASLLQGLYGRSCGYNKNSTVYLSENNASNLREYIRTKGKFVIHPHESVVVDKQKRGRKPMSITFDTETTNKQLLSAFKAIQETVVYPWLDNNANTLKSASKLKLKAFKNTARKVPLFDILNEEILCEIEKEIHKENPLIKISLLRPGKLDNNGSQYNIENNLCEIGFRNSQGGNRKSPNQLYPQLFVEKINNKWTLKAIQLRFAKPQQNEKGSYCLPSVKIDKEKIVGGLAAEFLTDEEKLKAKNMKGYKKIFFKDEMERF